MLVNGLVTESSPLCKGNNRVLIFKLQLKSNWETKCMGFSVIQCSVLLQQLLKCEFSVI